MNRLNWIPQLLVVDVESPAAAAAAVAVKSIYLYKFTGKTGLSSQSSSTWLSFDGGFFQVQSILFMRCRAYLQVMESVIDKESYSFSYK